MRKLRRRKTGIRRFPSLGIITGPLYGFGPGGHKRMVSRWMFEVIDVG